MAALVLLFAGWVDLARSKLAGPGSSALGIRTLTWVFASHFALNTAGNLSSESAPERRIMTPLAAVLNGCFFIVALS